MPSLLNGPEFMNGIFIITGPAVLSMLKEMI